jgi:hypothetical protein
MNTTAVFVELLVLGIQATIWMVLLCMALLNGTSLPQPPSGSSDWIAIITIIAVAWFYSFGLIVDRAFDAMAHLFNIPKYFLRWRWVAEKAKTLETRRVDIEYKAGTLAAYQAYISHRLRIARGSFYNSVLVFLFAGWNILLHRAAVPAWFPVVLGTLSYLIIFVGGSLLAYSMLQLTESARKGQIMALQTQAASYQDPAKSTPGS